MLYGPLTEVSSTSVVVNVGWTHVCGVRSGTSVRIYVNGIMEESSESSEIVNLNNTASIFTGNIGDLNVPLNVSLDGLIKNARVYSRALSDSEVKTVFDATK